MRVIRLAVFVGLLVLAPTLAFAQATIAGIVRDTSGAVMPGVTVEAASPVLIEKIRTSLTDGGGQFRIVDLRPGTYTVTFTLAGFNTVKRDGVELTGNFVATLNVELRVGALAETVTVTGDAPTIDIQTVTQQRVMSKEVIDTIPSGRLHTGLAVLVPGVTTNTQDVGGTNFGNISPAMAIHGGRAGDQRFNIDGLSPASFEGTGQFTAYLPNMSSTAEMTIDTSASSAEVSQGGIQINLIPRDGGNTFRGTLFASGSRPFLQSSNYTDELKARGLATPNKLIYTFDVNPGFGGPVKKDKLWFYTAGRWNGSEAYVGNMFYNLNAGNPNAWTYVPDTSRPAQAGQYFHSVNARLTWQANQKNKFSVFYDDQSRCNCPDGASTRTPEASAPNYGFPMNRFVTGTWSSPVTNRLLLEAGLANHGESWHGAYSTDADPSLMPITEQSTGIVYHGIRTTVTTQYPEYFAELTNVRAALSFITGSHAVKVGFSDGWGYRDLYLLHNAQNLTYRFNNGLPNQLTEYATPYHAIGNQKADLGIYAQDKWTMSRLTLNLGVRFDYYNSYFPEQHLGPSLYTPTRNLDFPVTPLISWSDITPRLGAAYDVFGNGKTAIKVALNRYVQGVALQGTLGDQANPVQRLANVVTRSWTDTNRNFVPDCDLMNVGVNGECGAMSNQNFGKETPSTTYDPELLNGWGKRAYNWEFSASVQQEIAPRVSASVGYFRRWYGNFTVTDNRAVSAADYDRFQITAPVDPRLPDGGGHVVQPLYDLNPAKVGQVDNLFTSADGYGKQVEHWNGVDLTVNLRLAQGALLQGGMSTGRTVTDNCDVVAKVVESGPLGVPYCHQQTNFLTQVKFLGAYTIPKVEVQLSGTFQSLPGPQIAANYVATNAVIQPSLGRPLSGGAANATINIVTPGTMYGERLNQLDFRIGKVMQWGGARTLLAVDLFNALNANPVLTENSNYATWRQPQSVLSPRFAKISLQLDF